MSTAPNPVVIPNFGPNQSRWKSIFSKLQGLLKKARLRPSADSGDGRIILSSPREGYGARILETEGASDLARFVSEESKKGREKLLSSITLGSARAAIQSELQSVAQNCLAANWDGYGAAPVARRTVMNAARFADVVPTGLMVPSVGAEPDGSVTFEWYAAPRKTLSVSIDEEGNLHYAALIGSSKTYGSEAFVGLLPGQIAKLAVRVSLE